MPDAESSRNPPIGEDGHSSPTDVSRSSLLVDYMKNGGAPLVPTGLLLVDLDIPIHLHLTCTKC